LWTIQRAAFLERARREGIAWASWDGVQPSGWRDAFRWNDMLEDFGDDDPRIVAPPALFEVESLRGRTWRDRGNVDDIQACVRALRGEWVGDVRALPPPGA
jgi:hypothetical protein